MIAAANPIDELKAEIRSMTLDELREEFRAGLRVTIEHLTRCALVLVELEARGEKVQGVSEILLQSLRAVARGDMLAETIITFASKPTAMRAVGKLPLEEQRRVVSDPEEQRRYLETKQPRQRVHPGNESSQPNYLVAAKYAHPRDAAEMIREMLLNNGDPVSAWRHLLADPAIERLDREARKKAV